MQEHTDTAVHKAMPHWHGTADPAWKLSRDSHAKPTGLTAGGR